MKLKTLIILAAFLPTLAFADGRVIEDNTNAFSQKHVVIQCDDGTTHKLFLYPDRSQPWQTATWSFNSVNEAVRAWC